MMNLKKYDSPFSFSLMKKQFSEMFGKRNENNKFIFDLSQRMNNNKLKLKNYYTAIVK